METSTQKNESLAFFAQWRSEVSSLRDEIQRSPR
jgi:hypothetical protein